MGWTAEDLALVRLAAHQFKVVLTDSLRLIALNQMRASEEITEDQAREVWSLRHVSSVFADLCWPKDAFRR